MSQDSPNISPRAQALQAARRRLQWLEVEAHRMKAQLARLEADFEDDVADELADGEGRLDATADFPAIPAPPTDWLPPSDWSTPAPIATSSLPLMAVDMGERVAVIGPQFDAPPVATNAGLPAAVEWSPANPIVAATRSKSMLANQTEQRGGPLAQARSFVASFGIHIAALLILLPLTYATFVHKKPESPPPLSLVVEPALPVHEEIETVDPAIEGGDVMPTMFAENSGDVAGQLLSDLPLEPAAGGPTLLPDVDGTLGLPTTNSNPLATTAPLGEGGTAKGDGVKAGPLGAGRGGPGGTGGSAEFFGARSQGDRFVFVVDDSSSMKDGRLEAAVAELTRSVESMNRRQAFYVIFVSDKTYPMFYPDNAPDLILATPENIQRLKLWMGKVRLAAGKNRELIAAMDLAASLRPQAVYLLWDADLKYSESVKTDVMKHLAGPQPWSFTIHTLGMGTLSAESEANLAAIAKAHRGTYRRIDVEKSKGK